MFLLLITLPFIAMGVLTVLWVFDAGVKWYHIFLVPLILTAVSTALCVLPFILLGALLAIAR